MSQGDKSSYTDKQKRQAAHIETGYEKRVSARKLPKHGLGPPSTNSLAAAKKERLRQEPEMIYYRDSLDHQTSQPSLESASRTGRNAR
jgi:hypothetical protein